MFIKKTKKQETSKLLQQKNCINSWCVCVWAGLGYNWGWPKVFTI